MSAAALRRPRLLFDRSVEREYLYVPDGLNAGTGFERPCPVVNGPGWQIANRPQIDNLPHVGQFAYRDAGGGIKRSTASMILAFVR